MAISPPSPPAAPRGTPPGGPPDLICFSHLRWDSVFQRPQHLMTACARERRVFFFEEAVSDAGPTRLEIVARGGVDVAIPHVPAQFDAAAQLQAVAALLDQVIEAKRIQRYAAWYYTPMALVFSRHLRPVATVYDCMDELSAFAHAPRALRELEAELLHRADVVFTGGQSLYEAKRQLHPSVHAFPSSVEVPHFARARQPQQDPSDQASIPRPRLGFFGVIDERMDLALLDSVAASRPGWQIVLIGPRAKISAAALPSRANIHYLGQKSYQVLPAYLSGWDVALLPFAHNDATRFISPTKTPEYLAAGRPVISTSIRDVVRPYGERGFVRIADGVDAFVAAIEASLAEPLGSRLQAADDFLSAMSWEDTWFRMRRLMDAAARPAPPPRPPAPPPLAGQSLRPAA